MQKSCGKHRFFLINFVDISGKVRIINSCMDTHNDISMAVAQVRADFAASKAVAGTKQLRKALAAGTVRRVYLAKNADPAITEPLAQLCREKAVPCAWVRTMAELGAACGIQVGAAAAATIGSDGITP